MTPETLYVSPNPTLIYKASVVGWLRSFIPSSVSKPDDYQRISRSRWTDTHFDDERRLVIFFRYFSVLYSAWRQQFRQQLNILSNSFGIEYYPRPGSPHV